VRFAGHDPSSIVTRGAISGPITGLINPTELPRSTLSALTDRWRSDFPG
jgi:hypothetical protein